VDLRINRQLSAGLSLYGRDLEFPLQIGPMVAIQDRRERSAFGYLYWLPSSSIAFTAQPAFYRFTHADFYNVLDDAELPLSLRFFHPTGFWGAVVLTGVWQRGRFNGTRQSDADGDHFWVADVLLAYRLPHRSGTVSLCINNLFNRTFKFQELGSDQPRFIPERQLLLRISLSL